MSQWNELDDYIYVVGATSQSLYVQDVCMFYFDKFFILGSERHNFGGSVVEDFFTVYDYDVNTNTLAKHLDGDDLIATLENESYGPDGLFSYTLNDYPDDLIWMGSAYLSPMVVASVTLTGPGGLGMVSYQTTIIVNADTNTIVYESYADNDVFHMGDDGVLAPYFKAYTYWNRTYLIPRNGRLNYPEWIKYENSGLKVFTPRILGAAQEFYEVPEDPRFIALVTDTGIEYIGDEIEQSIGYDTGTRINMTEEHVIAGSSVISDVKYSSGSVLYTEINWDYIFTYNEAHQTTSATEDLQRILKSIIGYVIYTEPSQSGNPFTNTYGPLTCQNEFYWNGIFYRNHIFSDNNLFYISLSERLADDKWTEESDPNGYCTNAEWNEYKIFDGYTNSDPSFTHMEGGAFVPFCMVESDKSGSSKRHSLFSPVGPEANIDETLLNLYVEKSFKTVPYLYIWDPVYHNMFYTPLEGELSGEPTSITTLDDRIFIGGKSHTPAIFIDGMYLTSGIAPGTAAISGFINTAMTFAQILPTMTTSGLYFVSPSVRVFSVSGEAKVRLYGSDAFAHGSILPYRALLINYGIWDDISGTLPSGFVSRSIELEAATYICGLAGAIYSSTDLNTWSLFDTVDPIQATCLAYTNEFFVATPEGADSVIKSASLTSPNFVGADTGLPEGVTILDIDEETYADR